MQYQMSRLSSMCLKHFIFYLIRMAKVENGKIIKGHKLLYNNPFVLCKYDSTLQRNTILLQITIIHRIHIFKMILYIYQWFIIKCRRRTKELFYTYLYNLYNDYIIHVIYSSSVFSLGIRLRKIWIMNFIHPKRQ